MTVEDLIAELQKLPPTAMVWIETPIPELDGETEETPIEEVVRCRCPVARCDRRGRT
jgi:hypothetical protein